MSGAIVVAYTYAVVDTHVVFSLYLVYRSPLKIDITFILVSESYSQNCMTSPKHPLLLPCVDLVRRICFISSLSPLSLPLFISLSLSLSVPLFTTC